MKILVADYGMNVWYGALYDYENRLSQLKAIGFDGLERLHACTEAEVLNTSALAKRMCMGFATCQGNNPSESIRWTAALGKNYVWIENDAKEWEPFLRQAKAQLEGASSYGICAAIHNHLGTPVESQAQLEEFLALCPDAGLILDIGHLVGAGGDPLAIIDKYFDRIVMVHLKDFVYKNREEEKWHRRIRFCELGAGELGDLTGKVIERLLEKGYDGYVAVEHDTHLQDPLLDLKISRDYMKKFGM